MAGKKCYIGFKMKNAILALVVMGALGWGYYAFGQQARQPKSETQLAQQADTQAAQTVAALAQETKKKSGSIIFGGDIMLARSVESFSQSSGGWSAVLAQVNPTLSQADCRVANLESPLVSDKPATKSGSLVFAAKPEAIAVLTGAKITAVSLANNHITDQGLAGMVETQKILQENNIASGGAGKNEEEALAPQTITCGELKVGLIFATYGTNFGAEGVISAPLEGIIEPIKKAKATHDIVAVFVHWGGEYQALNSPFQQEMAHKYIDAGADLVIGSHPHVIQPIEIYKNKLIAYSLGNFVFDQEASGVKTEAVLLKTAYAADQLAVEVIPISIKKYFQPNIVANDKASSYLPRLKIENWQFSLPRS
jgi:poly-gamma-glutamate synthesis protein (capsule biosynthesis protein)